MLKVTSEKPVICKLHSVKKTEKGDGFKKKSTWEIGDLKSVDGHLTEGIHSMSIQCPQTPC